MLADQGIICLPLACYCPQGSMPCGVAQAFAGPYTLLHCVISYGQKQISHVLSCLGINYTRGDIHTTDDT